MSAATAATAATPVSAVSDFVTKNWKLIAVAVLATGAASAAVYALTSKPSAKPAADAGADSTSASGAASGAATQSAAAKRKKKAAAAAAATTAAAAGISAAASAEPAAKKAQPNDVPREPADSVVSAASDATAPPKEDKSAKSGFIMPEDVSALSQEERTKLAQEAKTLGNKFYGDRKFAEAVDMYTKAIILSPTAIYYSNRAAAHSYLENHEQVVADCTEALKIDSKYVKALSRRGLGYEKLSMLTEALNDYTVVCVLEGFRKEASMAAPDRVLKLISARQTQEIMQTKVARMPSPTFINAPSQATIVAQCEGTGESIKLIKEAFEHQSQRKWQEAFELCDKALEADDFDNDAIEAIARNLRGTFYFLMGRIDMSVEDLQRSLELDPTNINTLIKRGTLFMERGEIEKTVELFEKAESLDPTNVDLFYHRGQVRFLTNDFQAAIDDYTQSIKNEKPGDASVYVHIQTAVAKYKLNDLNGAEKKFKETKRLFPNSAEVYNYHGEILMDKQAFTEALKSFDKSIEMDDSSPLPYINKSILYLQWKQDLPSAEAECRKALMVDPLCDIAYTQLAQLLCHQNRIEEALKVYDDAIQVTRTEAEVMNVISCREAARAQWHVLKAYPGILDSVPRA
nr:TOM (translocase of outer membrane) complex component [Polyrhizophydium stewartii]